MSFPLVQKSLADDGIQISEDRLAKFVRRLLYFVGKEQAAAISLDPQLLLVVRRRLGLPLEPRGSRAVSVKPRRRYDPRNRRRRRITLAKKARPQAPPTARPRRGGPVLKDQPTPVGIVPEPSRAEIAEFEGKNRHQLGELNKVAVAKIRAIDRHVITNNRGTCTHIMTRADYREEDLQRLYGLTYGEARSCFITVDDPPPR